MMMWLKESLYAFNLTWSNVLWGLGLYLVTFIGSTVLVVLLLIKMPDTYFCDPSPRSFWSGRPPVLRWTGLLLKNLFGGLLAVLER